MPEEVRPHIPKDVGERVEKFKQNHLNAPKYKIYSTLVEHFIDKNGRWKPNAPEELKEKLGKEIAV